MGFRIESDQFSFLLKADILLCLSTLIGVIFFCAVLILRAYWNRHNEKDRRQDTCKKKNFLT